MNVLVVVVVVVIAFIKRCSLSSGLKCASLNEGLSLFIARL